MQDHERKTQRALVSSPSGNGFQVAPETLQNEYYEGISRALGPIQVVLYLVLFAFLILSLLFNTEQITYQNFYRFFKDLNASAEAVTGFQSDSLSYPADELQSFTLYRGGLAIAGNRAVTLFSATGRQTVSKSVQYQKPVAVGTGKYLLVYDQGGKTYSLYNSYTQIYTGATDYPIRKAAVSESGMYALITSSEEYPSVVLLYDDDFDLINRYNKSGYVTDVSLNEDGDRIAIMTAALKDAFFTTELMICKPGEASALAEFTVADALGLSCFFTARDNVYVLWSDGLRCFSDTGRQLSETLFEGRHIRAVNADAGGMTVVLDDAAGARESRVLAFDEKGGTLYDGSIPDAVDRISRYKNTVFLSSGTTVYRLNLKNKTLATASHAVGQRTLLAVSHDEFLLCSGQISEYVRFE